MNNVDLILETDSPISAAQIAALTELNLHLTERLGATGLSNSR